MRHKTSKKRAFLHGCASVFNISGGVIELPDTPYGAQRHNVMVAGDVCRIKNIRRIVSRRMYVEARQVGDGQGRGGVRVFRVGNEKVGLFGDGRGGVRIGDGVNICRVKGVGQFIIARKKKRAKHQG